MIRFLHLDYDLSLDVYNKCKSYIEVKGCYSNVAHSFLNYIDFIDTFKNIKISFGGFNPITNSVSDNIFFKHCFFVLDNKVIDPTIVLLLKNKKFNKEDIERKSLYFNILSYNKEEYRAKLIECGDTSLNKYTMRITNEFQDKLLNTNSENIILVG